MSTELLRRTQPRPFVQPRDCYVITTDSTIYVYVSLLFQFLTFSRDRENAECLLFIHLQALCPYLTAVEHERRRHQGRVHLNRVPVEMDLASRRNGVTQALYL